MFTIQSELEFSKITESVLNTAKLTTIVSVTNILQTPMVLVNASYLSSSGTLATLTVELRKEILLKMQSHSAMFVRLTIPMKAGWLQTDMECQDFQHLEYREIIQCGKVIKILLSFT
jgi:hypothetical protein